MTKLDHRESELRDPAAQVARRDATAGPSALSPPQTLLATSLQTAIDGINREQDQRREAQLYAAEWGTWDVVVLSLRRLSQTHHDSATRQLLESFYEGLLSALVKGTRRGRVRESALFSYLVTMFGVVEAEEIQEYVSSAVGRSPSAIESLVLRIASLLKSSSVTISYAPLATAEDDALSAPIPDRRGLRSTLRRAFARLAKRR